MNTNKDINEPVFHHEMSEGFWFVIETMLKAWQHLDSIDFECGADRSDSADDLFEARSAVVNSLYSLCVEDYLCQQNADKGNAAND